MEILEKVNDKTIVICESKNKDRILSNLHNQKQICNFKIMNLNEFIKKITFDYNEEAIYYLMKKYNLTYENALVYIKNLYFIENKDYGNQKLNKLLEIKEDLLNNNLLIIDDIFRNNILDKNIIFHNIKTDKKFIDKITKTFNIEFLDESYEMYPEKIIYNFETIEDEINYVAESICKLIDSGINIDKIKLLGLPTEYEFIMKNTLYNYGLFIEENSYVLFNTIIGKYFLDNLNSDINETINMLKNNFNFDNEETIENINKIINICNKYNWCNNYLDIKECLIYELKNTKTYQKKYDNYIEIVDINNVVPDDETYYFMLGFNNENYPKIYKNDNYIDDALAPLLNIQTSSEKNIIERENLINTILSIKNLIITYKNKTNFGEYYISNLNDYLNFKIEKITIELKDNYSLLNTKLEYSKKLDNFIKYGIKTEDLDMLYSNLKDIKYRTYDNTFKGIDREDLKEYLNNKLLLSYSSIDNFYNCQFSYYINNILKLNPFEEHFSAYIGSLIHYVLSIAFKQNFNYENEFNNYVKENAFDLTPKDKFFLKKIKEELKLIIDVIIKQKYLTNFNDELYEQKIYIEKENNINITFMGIIDKVMYMKKDGITYLSIVDYKTGSINTDLKYIDYGLQLQLPIYAYLILKSNLFDNPVISGLYYQKLISSEIKTTTEEDYNLQKQNNLKLIGLSTNDESILEQFDSTYENSDLIKGMKLTSKGFSSYSKVYSKNELEDMLHVVETKINEAIEKIVKGNFKINPKKIKFDNIGCKYCKFKDLCYMTENDVEIIEEGD